MTTITEGRLTFTFPDQSTVDKYDDWSFYRNQFNSAFGGTKAVDLIYIAGSTTWLIEVKDYRVDRRTKAIDLCEEVAIKVRDTLAGLVAAQSNASQATEKDFAKKAIRARSIRVVLHLEQPRNPSKLFPSVIAPANAVLKLRQQLRGVDAHPEVVDQHSLQPDMNWTVQG